MKKIMFISSVGGHLTQLLQLQSLFKQYQYLLITEKTKVTIPLQKQFTTKYMIYGSRKGFHLFLFPFVVLLNCFASLYYFFKFNPDVIITTGTHVSVGMCYLGKILKRKIIFIESFAKQEDLTLSGKLVYPIANYFIVQWPKLHEKYSKSYYFGGIY